MFPWATFRKTKAAIKMHTLLDLKGSIPTFISVTPAAVHDVNLLDVVPVEKDSVVTMDRGYTDFARLYAIHLLPAFFVVRAKSNLRFHRLSSIRSERSRGVRGDQVISLVGYKSRTGYPESLRRIAYVCLLYTSDAADDLLCVDLGGRRIIKKKKKNKNKTNI